MATSIPPVFSEGVGYGIIVGLGAAFALGMGAVSWGLERYFAEVQTSEMFMTAKHSVKTGLTASAVVSSWTIAATLLTSTTEGYLYGVSGPFWYGAGASVQILLFSVAAIELKRKAPNAHTFLEVARTRYGAGAHITLGCYSLFYQIIQAVNLLVGGSTVFSALTGMNRDAACFLFPLGVMFYTLLGGIKATFLTDWAHTVVIYVIMLTALFTVYTTSNVVGSTDKMFELLQTAAQLHPVEGNADGSYLTMRSQGGGYIGLIFVGAGFAAAVDSQLFQKAIAADPSSTLAGYLIGGSSWFTIPFVLATTFGLTAAATEHLPSFPTYPNRMTSAEVSTGLAMPYGALAVMGKGGGVAVLLMAFMAVTSAMSSETVATAALLTYDFYQAYINPQATGEQLVRFSHYVVVGFGLFASAIAVGFNHAGFSVTFLVTAIGIIVDSAIIPMACTLMWKKQSKAAVILSPLISSTAAIAAWLATAYTHFGSVTIATTSENLPLVAGNMMSLGGPIVLTPLITYLRPDNYDWHLLKNIKQADDADITPVVLPTMPSALAADEALATKEEIDDSVLLRARKWSIIASIFLTLAYLILWPIPMYATSYVFSEGFFKGWIVVVFLWAFYASSVITLLPLWEGRHSIASFALFTFGIRSKKSKTNGEFIEGLRTDSLLENNPKVDEKTTDVEMKQTG
ncbi:Na+/solute symporter [Mollisia scopiformis]|uniref:Na+/solute symporter n=1 Tax=Mollisia scopiformis TaxID=149040 RepID=A0A194WYR5_MOLSC|nr:Na+/solute symporter [Mollisia scopiformis]KUJ13090.1 Na+/solute symporter [Mollisia scopiformis]